MFDGNGAISSRCWAALRPHGQLRARAQQPAMPVIGYFTTGTSNSDAVPLLAAFREGLRATGRTEGRMSQFNIDGGNFKPIDCRHLRTI